jgi:GTPase involved in cell partitioning and DNA repair
VKEEIEFEILLKIISGSKAPIQWVREKGVSRGGGGGGGGGKRPGFAVDHSLPFSVELKNVWSYNSSHPLAFME